jgi:3D-(3,5/4)-trihydroxycyclohexane-1,2-dione acylhydrolase (decyclizing)
MMAKTIKLTAAQALVKFLCNQMTMIDGKKLPIFAGVWAIFGHGNVAGIGEALFAHRKELPTFRGHNEQSMAHAATAFAKASNRRRMMAVSTSIGPGALNLITAAAVAHVNRIPLLLLPGDVFASRFPDPVLQQVEDFNDGTISANDCFKPVSRYFDRIVRPEQLIPAMNRAMTVLTDPADCGPVTISMCQDTQAEAYDYPEDFFAERIWSTRRPRPDTDELAAALKALQAAKKPVIVAGGGVLYSQATEALKAFADKHGIPVVETQAGKSSLPFLHELNMGAVGVTGTAASNTICEQADVIFAVGTRLQDFTTGSWSLFKEKGRQLLGLNTQSFDATKHRALPLVADARVGLEELTSHLGKWRAPAAWTTKAKAERNKWIATTAKYTKASNATLPADSQVIGAVQRALGRDVTVLCAAGTMPGELHKLWEASYPGSYHMEYGFSCMGYEIAGGIGAKMANPDREIIVWTGDGTYMMANSELATAVMMGIKITLIITDNRGYGCISRLQHAAGGERFNNLFDYNTFGGANHAVDFVKHTQSMGADAVKVKSLAELEHALKQAKASTRTTAIVIDTDPMPSTDAGGTWWDVGIPEVSTRKQVRTAHSNWKKGGKSQRIGS